MSFSLTKKLYKDELDKEIKKSNFNEKNIKKYEEYGDLIIELDNEPFNFNKCSELIEKYNNIVLNNIKDKCFSGTIYTNTNAKYDYKYVKYELPELYAQIIKISYYWNSLHDKSFIIGNIINYQIVCMLTNIFGGKIDEVIGILTNGGSQSLMNIARSYMNYGIEIGIDKPVIIAPDTIHASLMKAEEAYKFELVLIKTDYGIVNEKDLIYKIKYYKNRLVALFCSTPSYAYGIVDDVKLFSNLACKYKIGLHIDACLGGFVINYLRNCKYFEFNGVTSISIDLHKNALTPKDASVLLCKKLNNKNLMYYSIYAVEKWNMLYGTPQDNGSKGVVLPLCALITLLYYGNNFYKEQALKINKTIIELKEFLEKSGEIEIITKDPINVLAFKLNNKYEYGLTYKLNDLLEEKGFELTALNNDIIHICITNRFCETNSLINLKSAINECITKIKEIKNYKYDGTAKLYCSINMVLNPKKEFSFKYIGELLFGRQMIIDIIKHYYLSLMNPKYKKI